MSRQLVAWCVALGLLSVSAPALAQEDCSLPIEQYLDQVSGGSPTELTADLKRALVCLNGVRGTSVSHATAWQKRNAASELAAEIVASTSAYLPSRDKDVRCSAVQALAFHGGKVSPKQLAKCSMPRPEQQALLFGISKDKKLAKKIVALFTKATGTLKDEERARAGRTILEALGDLEDRRSLPFLKSLLRKRQYEPFWDQAREIHSDIDGATKRPGETTNARFNRVLKGLSGDGEPMASYSPGAGSRAQGTGVGPRRSKRQHLSAALEVGGFAGKLASKLEKKVWTIVRAREGRTLMCFRHERGRNQGSSPSDQGLVLRLQLGSDGAIASVKEEEVAKSAKELAACLATGLVGQKVLGSIAKLPVYVDYEVTATR
tara:strand:- start:1539 stop:2666 length:1128 start_codon:yes stop_codon:yes gene_type:complete